VRTPGRLRALGAVKRRRVNPARRAQGASGLIDADKSSSDAPRRVGDAVTDEVVHGPPWNMSSVLLFVPSCRELYIVWNSGQVRRDMEVSTVASVPVYLLADILFDRKT